MSNRSAQGRSGRRRTRRLAKKVWRFIAPPPRLTKASPWSVAADWALLGTLLLTIGIMVLCSELCGSVVLVEGESKVSYEPSGQLVLDGGRDDPVIGSIKWRAAYRECGWPFPIRRQPLPIIASWTLDDPPETVASSTIPTDHPLAPAIDAKLAKTIIPDWYKESIRVNRDRPGESSMLWTNATVTLGLIWLILYLLIRIPMVFLRAGLIMQRRFQTGVETRRDRSGRCIQCGYNLTGLEMAERCPECGTLLW